MIVVMEPGASPAQLEAVVQKIREAGLGTHLSVGTERTIIGVVGDSHTKELLRDTLEATAGVEKVVRILQPFKLVSREFRPVGTVVRVGSAAFGDAAVAVAAGPCSVESREQIMQTAEAVKAAGAVLLRGGAFKPRTSPYAFQGLGRAGLELLARAREETGLAIVTEALEPDMVDLVAEYADIIQIGARNMQNYPLLRRAGRTGKPVLLKRGLAATIKELLLSAEYILAEGNGQVILCERGVRGFDEHTRNLLDLTAIPVVHALSHLPIIADPSHGTGVRSKVTPMARAAVAAGAVGIMVEVHPQPERALSDGAQSLDPDQFDELVAQVRLIAHAIGRTLAPPLPAPR